MTENRKEKYYTATVRKEWNRLDRNADARLEFETTFHSIEKYLHKKGRILDAGGGLGRHTVELAERGYQGTPLNLPPRQLGFAHRKIRQAKV